MPVRAALVAAQLPKKAAAGQKGGCPIGQKKAENKGFEPSPRRSEDDVSSVAQPTVSDYSPCYCANGQTRTANLGLEDRDFTLKLHSQVLFAGRGISCASESRTRSFSLMRAVCYRYTTAQLNCV